MRVFVSSTSSDLAIHRAAAVNALRQLGHEVVVMDVWPAGSDPPLRKVMDEVARCEAWIGIFAWHYGELPQTPDPTINLPGGTIGITSITHWEYLQAKAQKLPIMAFLVAENHPWPPHLIDGVGQPANTMAMEKIQELRNELRTQRVVSYFTEPSDLEAKVSAAITVTGMSRQVTLNIAEPMQVPQASDSSGDSGLLTMVTNAGASQVAQIDLSTEWWTTRLYLAAFLAERLTAIRQFLVVETHRLGSNDHPERKRDPFVGLIATGAILSQIDHLPTEVRRFAKAAARGSPSGQADSDEFQRFFNLWSSAFNGDERKVKTDIERHMLSQCYPYSMLTQPVRVTSLSRADIVDLLRLLDYPNNFVPVVEEEPQVEEENAGKLPDNGTATANPAFEDDTSGIQERVRIVDKSALNAQLAASYVRELRDRARPVRKGGGRQSS